VGRTFAFEPGAWLRDTRTLPLALRGFWIDLLCVMHEGSPRGTLTHPTGAHMTIEDVARAVGVEPAMVTELVAELLRRGVAAKGEGGALLASRRMARDKRVGPRSRPQASESVTRVAQALAEAIAFNFPKLTPKPERWVGDIEKLLRLDHVPEVDALAIVAWLRDGTDRDAEFWRGNILSGKKLRVQFGTLMVRFTASARSRGPGRRQAPSAPADFKGGKVDL